MTENWIAHFTSTKTSKTDQDIQAYLFCFGHGGSSPSDFYSWDDYASNHLRICPICLPGHGDRRARDPPSSWQHVSVSDLARLIAPALERYAGSKPCALFGHSYGALLAYETAKRMRISKPVYLIFSGRNAPDIPDPKPDECRISGILNDNDFVREMAQRYNDRSLADASAKHPEMMEFFLPQLRADMESFETYKYAEQTPGSEIECPMCVCAGTDDPRVSDSGLDAWKRHTKSKAETKIVRFPGDHFYTKTDQAKYLVSHIEKIVLDEVSKRKKKKSVDTMDICGMGGYSDYNPYEDPNFGFC